MPLRPISELPLKTLVRIVVDEGALVSPEYKEAGYPIPTRMPASFWSYNQPTLEFAIVGLKVLKDGVEMVSSWDGALFHLDEVVGWSPRKEELE